MRQNFLRVLLYVMLLGVPLSVRSVNWVPVGEKVNCGFAVDASNGYHQGDNIDDDQHSLNNASFYATDPAVLGGDNILNLYGTLYTDYNAATQVTGAIPCALKVNGNISIEALEFDAIVNVNEDTTIIPFFDLRYTPTVAKLYSQVFFNTGLDGDGNPRVIDVNMYSDLTFSGTTAIAGGPDPDCQDMIVTFAGPGMVRFNMSDGTSLWFDGQADFTDASGTTDGGLTYNYNTQMFNWAGTTPSESIGLGSGGCKVFVTMDQYPEEVEMGNCKLLFQRAILPVRAPVEQNTRVMVYFGPNAIFTYLSDNASGIVDQDVYPDGYGRVAFDPSCNMLDGVAGRMVLFVAGAYSTDINGVIDAKYPMNDGGVLINGHYCPRVTDPDGASYAPADIIDETGYGYDFSTPAGVGAKFMVFDQTYYDNANPTAENPYDPSIDDRRGLLVINDCQNISRLFADPYWDVQEADVDNYSGCSWAQSNPENSGIATRRGFVLGVNGEVEIYPNTFLDHVSGAVNQVDPFEAFDILNPDAWQITNPGMDLSYLKQRNPAAFIFDGLDTSLFDLGNPLRNDEQSEFVAADPLVQNNDQVRALVSLYGDGALYSRACASSQYGYLYNFWSQQNPLENKTLDYTGILAVGTGTYDAYQLSANDDTVQEGEGIHVYDFEGEGWIQGLYNTDAIDIKTGTGRFYTTEYTDAGVFSAPTVLIDDTGHEVLPEGNSYVWIYRPLLNDGTPYTRYNSPTIFFNNFGTFHNAIFNHTDATKYVNGVPAFSEPAITGGERYYFAWEAWSAGDQYVFWFADPNRYRVPEIRLIGNSTLELHESCCASGIRYTVLDVPNVPLSADGGDTYATVRFFDHGDPLDTMNTGYGRVWMLGSNMNYMADSVYDVNTGTWSTPSRNYATDSCFLNIFKHNSTADVTDPLDNASLVRLYLSNGDEFDPSVPDTQYDLQRAHHLIAISQPDEDIANAIVNAKIGWFTKQGYSDPLNQFPGTYPYNDEDIAEPLGPFENDALVTPNSRLYIDGSFMCFTSFDKFGSSLPMPIRSADDNGFLYVNSGGNLSVNSSEGDIHTQLQNHAIVSTGVAREIWNDSEPHGIYEDYEYSGQVYMPFDQVKFDPNYSIFIYNLTAQMWEDPQNPASGTMGVRIFPQDGEEEMGISWFWRELQNPTQYIPIKYPDNKAFNFRVTESPNMPVAETLDVVYFGGGDVVQQLKVFGATQSDPLHIGISGDGYSSPFYSDVREIVSCKSTTQATDRFISEGAHGVLFVELGGQVRLGSSEWNNHSLEAWNKLGKDYVTIVPMQGGGTVVLNDNLLVTARMALVAGQTFGSTTSDRLSFYSESPYEIRVPAGVELDLSSFGQNDYMQEIEFGGKVRLVLEAGATIRLPENGSNIALYFNDEAELVFEEPDALGQYVPFYDAAEADFYVSKIFGRGWFFVNKDAKILVNDNARVRIGTDELTPTTNVIFSLTRNGQLNIGNDTTAGGVLEIGNYAYQPGGASIKAKFLLADDSIFNIAREGCLALSTIIVNKNGNPNGFADPTINPVMNGNVANVDSFGRPVFNPDIVAADGAWTFIPAFNVDRIEFEMNGGTFDHKNIVDGKSSNASLIAVGPTIGDGVTDAYFFSLNSSADASVLGGGNLMFIPELQIGQSVYTANIWDFQGTVSTGETYGILASGLSLLDQREFFVSTIYGTGGRSFSFAKPTDFFKFMTLVNFDTKRVSSKKVDYAITPFGPMIAYPSFAGSKIYAPAVSGTVVPAAQIFRISGPGSINQWQSSAINGSVFGYGDAVPNTFSQAA